MTTRDRIENLRERIKKRSGLADEDPEDANAPAIADDDSEKLLELSRQLDLLNSKYSDYRHEKLLRHCVIMAEQAGELADALESRDAVEKVVVWINTERDTPKYSEETNAILHAKLFPTRTTELTVLFLRELKRKQSVEQATFLVDDAHSLKAALNRLGFRFRMCRHGNRNAIERVFREVKRRTSWFSNTFSHADPTTAESWLQAFAVWWNRC